MKAGVIGVALWCLAVGAGTGYGQAGAVDAAPPPAAASATANDASLPAWAKTRDGKVLPPHVGTGTPTTHAPAGLYVAMGDSITFGVGQTPNCSPFPDHPVDVDEFCPEGKNYAVVVARELRKQGVAGHFMNLGIGGAHVEQVTRDELPYLPAEATLVTLYIGTNDSRAVFNGHKPAAEVVAQFEQHFDELVKAIHAKAPKARIVLINFPNQQYLAASYHVPDAALAQYNATSQILDSFIDDHYPAYAVVDTVCNPNTYDQSLIYKASVHPNEAGAAILADSVLKVVLARKPEAPPTSCTWFDKAAVEQLKNVK